MVLERVRIQKLCASAVAEDQAVCRRAVVIGRREALIVESARTAGREDDGFCPGNQNFFCLHVLEHRARAAAVFVLEKLDGRREVHNLNAAV